MKVVVRVDGEDLVIDVDETSPARALTEGISVALDGDPDGEHQGAWCYP